MASATAIVLVTERAEAAVLLALVAVAVVQVADDLIYCYFVKSKHGENVNRYLQQIDYFQHNLACIQSSDALWVTLYLT